MDLTKYDVSGIFDEMMDDSGACRTLYQPFMDKLSGLSSRKLQQLQHSTDKTQLSMGMTFNVYHESEGMERILHLDIIPRIISGEEWEKIEAGLKQRIRALNLFLDDIYNDRAIIRDGVIPEYMVLQSYDYLVPCVGLKPPSGIW